jgi:hypothetical protein
VKPDSTTIGPPGTCLIHGPYAGLVCPTCSTSVIPFPQPRPQAPQGLAAWVCRRCRITTVYTNQTVVALDDDIQCGTCRVSEWERES